MDNTITLNHIILGYRNLLTTRYQYDTIKQQYDLPTSFDEAKINQFRAYFLNYVYPTPEKRKELDVAFQNLDNYIKNPEKLLRILIDSGSLLFKYGRHLPKILKAGLRALKSFRGANQLEQKLVKNAIALNAKPPFSTEAMKAILGALPYKELMEFTKNNEILFETLYDQTLVKKIVEIVEHLITKMKRRPRIYSVEEVKALSIGRDIIKNGNALFAQLNQTEQQQILETVLKIELDFIKGLYV